MSDVTLAEDERQLLKDYRELSADTRKLALMILERLTRGEFPEMTIVSNSQHGNNNRFSVCNNNWVKATRRENGNAQND